MTPEIIAGLASGSSNIIGAGVDAVLQSNANKAQQRYATYMYDRQRADALSDWNRQNLYNSPQMQMARFRAAGLNPNLIYGQTNTAAPVRSSSQGSYKPEAPRLNLGNAVGQGIDTFYDVKMKKMQIDTMQTVQELNKARKSQVDADTILKGASKGLVDINTAARAFKLGLDKSLVGVTVDTASAQLDKLRAEKDRIVTETFYKMHEDIRRELLTSATFAEKMQHIASMITGQKLSEAQINKINAEIDMMGTTQYGKDLQNRLSKKIIDNFTMDQIRKWIVPLVNPIGGLMK